MRLHTVPHRVLFHISARPVLTCGLLALAFGIGVIISFFVSDERVKLEQQVSDLQVQKSSLSGDVDILTKQLNSVKNDDQFVRNQKLTGEIKHIQETYKDAVTTYEELLKVKDLSGKTQKLDELFTKTLLQLSQKEYASAAATLNTLTVEMQKLKDAVAASFVVPSSVPASNTAPGSGYNRQSVNVNGSIYLVDIIAGNLSSTKVIVDTASNGDCGNDCPVLSLGDYVSRSGAYAGINGGYFCPSTYPSCQDKKNSFDTLLMNKNKVYFNSSNNVYSVVPAVIFPGNSVRFVEKSLEWGRDTGVDGVIANQPLLVFNNEVKFGGNSDPKQSSKGSRGFVANIGNTVYIGMVHNVTVAEMATVLKTMGMNNAINLDSGGSAALWFNGYKVGPGRNIPNAILFVRR